GPARPGPSSERVVQAICVGQPRVAYQVFACSRSSSALIARVAPYEPAVPDATASTRMPSVDLRSPAACAALMNTACAPGRSSYSVTHDMTTLSEAVPETLIEATSDLKRLMVSSPANSGNAPRAATAP